MSRQADRTVLSVYGKLSRKGSIQSLLLDKPQLIVEIYKLHSGRPRGADRPEILHELIAELSNSYLNRHRYSEVDIKCVNGEEYFLYNGIRISLTDEPRRGRNEIKLPCSFPNRSPGFFTVDSIQSASEVQGGLFSRLYVRQADWMAAFLDFKSIVNWLDDQRFENWSAKIASTSNGYPSNDAIVIYIPTQSVSAVEKAVPGIISQRTLSIPSSPFTRDIGNGVSVASEPIRIRRRNLSFGESRATLVAEVLIDVFKNNANVFHLSKKRCVELGINFNDISENQGI